MKELTIFITQSLLGWLPIQMCLALVFLLYLRLHQENLLTDEELPKTAVILCLRGADPFLPNCIEALLNQDYPEYDLKLIVDSPQDPAWQIVNDTINEQGASNVQVSPLRIIRHNCSLKCSSLLQAV